MLCAIYSLKSRATYLYQLHQLISQMTKNRQNKIYLVTNHGNQGLQLYHNLPQTTWGQNTKHSGQWCYLEKPKVIISFLQSKENCKAKRNPKDAGVCIYKKQWKSLIFLCQVVGTFIIVIKHWKMQHFLDLLKLKYKLTKFSIYDDVWLKHNPVLRVWNQDLVKKHSGNTQLQVIYIYLQNPEVWVLVRV